MYRILFIILFFIFTSCSKKKEVKHTIFKEYESSTYVLLKERISEEETTKIAKELISKKESKNLTSVCFFLNRKKNETPIAIVYFLNSKIHKVIYDYDEEKYNKFFSLKFNENIVNHWELKYSSRPNQTFIYKKDNQLFYKSLMIDFYSEKLYSEYIEPLKNIDTLNSGEIKFQLENNDSLRRYLIDKDKNLKTFYKNKFIDVIYPKTR